MAPYELWQIFALLWYPNQIISLLALSDVHLLTSRMGRIQYSADQLERRKGWRDSQDSPDSEHNK